MDEETPLKFYVNSVKLCSKMEWLKDEILELKLSTLLKKFFVLCEYLRQNITWLLMNIVLMLDIVMWPSWPLARSFLVHNLQEGGLYMLVFHDNSIFLPVVFCCRNVVSWASCLLGVALWLDNRILRWTVAPNRGWACVWVSLPLR